MYYDYPRPEVQALVPPDAKIVLDVGCGSGVMGAELKKKGLIVDGIEINPDVAWKAKEVLDSVEVLDVESYLPHKKYDCVIFSDVLEHLRDPLAVVKRFKWALTDDGRIIASIPNVAHWSIVKGLQEGNWQYTEAGILDKTHLRFFTRKSIVEMFVLAGMEIEEMQAKVTEDPLMTGDESVVYQYLVRVKVKEHPLVSIVIPVHNQLEYTRKCYESILRYTSEPYEIIFVDNASTDGTREFFRGMFPILLPENRGFGEACNAGIKASKGEYIVLLNNDVEVTEGWIEKLLFHIGDAGMIGPVTNYASGYQQMPLGAFGTVCEVPRLIGFCLMVKREVFDKIGLFDPRFGIGNYEDDDLCIRAKKAGYKLLMAADTFVFHHGSKTFQDMKIDFEKLMNENWEKFKEKYNLPKDRKREEGYRFDEV